MLKSLSINFPDRKTGYYIGFEDRELDFLKQHTTLTSLTIREQVVDHPLELRGLTSITLSGWGFGLSLHNGIRPTSLMVMKSLTIQATNELITIAGRDEDGNSIACLVRHDDMLQFVGAWRAYLQFPLETVENLYLNLVKDTELPYDMICGLTNVKTVYVTWVFGRVEKVIKKVAEIMSYPPDRQGLRMGRWVKGVESSRVATVRNDLFKYYVESLGWECV